MGDTRTMVRVARSEDFAAVLELYRQLQPDDPVVADDSDRRTFERIIADPGLHIIVLEVGGRIVATTYLNVIPNVTRSAAPYAVVENVVVDAAVRGAGFGKQIMASTLLTAWEAGCYKVMLMTGSEEPSTYAFYRSCGFDGQAKTAYIARRGEQDRPGF